MRRFLKIFLLLKLNLKATKKFITYLKLRICTSAEKRRKSQFLLLQNFKKVFEK